VLAEPAAEELLIGDAVELHSCVSEVVRGQAGIEAASEADRCQALKMPMNGDLG
jgi:hypothetical protein